MEELALKIDHVSKEYRLGTIGGRTLKAEIQSKVAKLRKKEDPNLKIGQKTYGKNERFLALNDISLEIRKGETIGIIGHNGAGKSTLLKLICRVTAPTKGDLYINGRITSMLEVGTGFHDELTGKENIYLNGTILGMTKKEIDEVYDDIVEFSEIEQFIDTPVKRYSSGMKVKLGFAVASHLKSEIVIMDEVLAVGDVSFQNKCINRMKQLAQEEGRTVLYVSHNMMTVKSLCERCIVLSHGQVAFAGPVDESIAVYMQENITDQVLFDTSTFKRNHKCNLRHLFQSVELLNKENNSFKYGEKILLRINWKSENDSERLLMKSVLFSADKTAVGVLFGGELKQHTGMNSAEYTFDTKYLVPGKYYVDIKLYDEDDAGHVVYYDQCRGFSFSVEHCDESIHLKHWFMDWGHAVLPCFEKKE